MKRKTKPELAELFLHEFYDKLLEDDFSNILYAIYKKGEEKECEQRDREYIISFSLASFDSDDASIIDDVCDLVNKKWCSDWELEEEGHYHISWEVQSDYLNFFFKF